MNRIEHIRFLYNLILGREADQSGLNHYDKSDMSISDIQCALWNSDEFRNKINVKLHPKDPIPLYNNIPILVINLDRRPDRKNTITKELENLGIKNYEIVSAIDGKKLTSDELNTVYDNKQSREIHRVMTATEVACALSHIECAKKIINDNLEYAIILEDDAELTLDFKEFLKEFNSTQQYGFDFLILGSFSSNQFFNGKAKNKQSPYKLIEKESIIYLDKIKYNIGFTTIHDAYYPTKELDYVHGTHAYVMSKNGAKKLLALNYPVIVEADNMWNYFPESCNIEFTNPILCHRQHLDSDIHTGRISLVNDDNNFSENFLKRKYHPDFGT